MTTVIYDVKPEDDDEEIGTMKVTREQATQNRERVVEMAARLFRERGLAGIGVADLMKSAGLTHGGFYGQFASKEELIAQACARGFEVGLEDFRRAAENAPDAPLAAVTGMYLSTAHRDQPGAGCVVAALGAEAARQGPAVRQSFTDGVRAQLAFLVGLLPGRSADVKRRRALAAYAGMVGALVLARAVDDEALSQEFLDAATAAIVK